MLDNTREFNVPYLSLIKQLPKIITTEDNNDTPDHDKEIIFDNIFYHIIPYIIATEKELDRYNALISYDLFISYLSWYDTETKVKFLSSALRNQKKPTRIHKSLKQIYTIFYSEYKQTNFGKSLCFYATALQSSGLCIVIEPLISLIHNQVSKLNKIYRKFALAC